MKFNGLRWMTLFAAVSCGAVAATAQVTGNSDLNLPANPQFLSNEDPTIRKATAIVNGDVITATDIDQRLALYMIANQGTQIPPDEMQRIRQQNCSGPAGLHSESKGCLRQFRLVRHASTPLPKTATHPATAGPSLS